MSIIKRRKTSNYAQIHNEPLQGDLKDLRAVGLLSHIMSLPENWTLHKTQLQSFYSRKNVDAGWKELVEKSYAIGFNCYRDGKINYFYNVSDIPFSKDEFDRFVIEQIAELLEQGFSVKNPKSISHSNLDINEKLTDVLLVQHSDFTDVPAVQYSENCTQSTYTKKQTNKEILTKKQISSSSNLDISEEVIDKELKSKYPSLPFDDIKNHMLEDESLIIKTEKQYRSMLDYRLKNYKPKKLKNFNPKKRNVGREAIVPSWFNKNYEQSKEKLSDQEKSVIEERRRKLRESINKRK